MKRLAMAVMKRSTTPKTITDNAPPANANPPINLEEALRELESIVTRLEDPSTTLEEAISQYSRGMELSKACAQRLAGLERQILLVQRGSNGEPTTVEFEPEETGDAESDIR
jgi:exodeoxyribonuclease VII small subunit